MRNHIYDIIITILFGNKGETYFMIYEPCKWYKNTRHKSPLDNFIEEKSTGISSVYCENDIQTMAVKYIQCVKLDDIEKIEPWSPSRTIAIRRWATPDNLRRLKYQEEEETGKRVIPFDEFHNMPMLSREYKLKSNNSKVTNQPLNSQSTKADSLKLISNSQEKFKITDGIHRINRARELGMDCILASVEERVNVKKTDIENIELK